METVGKSVGCIVAIIVAILVVVGLAIGSWHLGWFITKADTNKQSEIYNDSFQRQNALVSEAGRIISDVKAVDVQIASVTDPAIKAPLAAQRKALVTQACETIGKFSYTVSVPDPTITFKDKECK